MKKLLETLEKLMDAVTFAEAGEFDTARRMMPAPRGGELSSFERVFMAVAFAEEGLRDEAIRIIRGRDQLHFDLEGFFSAVGLEGTRVRIGVLGADASI